MPAGRSALPLTLSQIKPAAAVLARAFYQDPFFTFVIPDGSRRVKILPWLFERMLRYGLRYGRVLGTPSLEGVAIWLGPENPSLRLPGALWSGLFLLPFKLGCQGLLRSLRLEACAGRLHKTCLTSRHWYLVAMGVEPSLQGQGLGAALLAPILAQADRDALACYLETNNQTNLPFYQRNGFTVVGHAQAIPSGPYTWGMLRKPKRIPLPVRTAELQKTLPQAADIFGQA
jgi:GNAT superfamily N-acetyltransferase